MKLVLNWQPKKWWGWVEIHIRLPHPGYQSAPLMGSTCDADPARGGRGHLCPLQECPEAEEEKEPAAGKPKSALQFTLSKLLLLKTEEYRVP